MYLLEIGSILLNGLAMFFILQQLWYPYHDDRRKRAWLARLLTAFLMTVRRIVWMIHMEGHPGPEDLYELAFTYAVSLSLLNDSYQMALVYRRRLTLPDLPPARIVINASSTILAWDAQATALFGWAAEEALNKDLAELVIHAQDRTGHRSGMARWYATDDAGRRAARRLFVTACHKDHTEMPIEITVRAHRAADGTLTCEGEVQPLIPLWRAVPIPSPGQPQEP